MFFSIISTFQHIPGLGVLVHSFTSKLTLALGLWNTVSRCNSKKVSNRIFEQLFKKVPQVLRSFGTNISFKDTFESIAQLSPGWICFLVLCKPLVAWLLVRGVWRLKHRRRGRHRYFPWRGCALPRCNLRALQLRQTNKVGWNRFIVI